MPEPGGKNFQAPERWYHQEHARLSRYQPESRGRIIARVSQGTIGY